ncbi:MAG: DUF5654 family protein [Patescibacteria group bacterium]|nr:DUF5654 family protein [Patescibacteria group bacterium]
MFNNQLEELEAKVKEEIREEFTKTPKRVWKASAVYILAGLGLVVGLAWNDAIQSLVKILFPLDTASLGAKFVYAVIITIALVIIAGRLGKYVEK